jgi:hypothetical protein
VNNPFVKVFRAHNQQPRETALQGESRDCNSWQAAIAHSRRMMTTEVAKGQGCDVQAKPSVILEQERILFSPDLTCPTPGENPFRKA